MSARLKLKHASGWAMLFGWFLFGAACASDPKPAAETALRALLDVIEIVCPPEITVGDCASRVKAWLPPDQRDGGVR